MGDKVLGYLVTFSTGQPLFFYNDPADSLPDYKVTALVAKPEALPTCDQLAAFEAYTKRRVPFTDFSLMVDIGGKVPFWCFKCLRTQKLWDVYLEKDRK